MRPHVESLVDYLEASAARVPDRTAVIDSSGRRVTYRELDEQADRIAGFLVEHGVHPGDRVGVIAPKGAEPVSAFFGIMKARAAYVPADWTAPPARNRTILADCEVKAVFLAASAAPILRDWPADRPLPSAVVFFGDTCPKPDGADVPAFPWRAAASHPPARVDGRSRDDLAYILYTSGSTGVPKGVMLTHENALSFVDWCSETLAPDESDRFSSHAPFHFDLSVLDLYVPVKHGAAVCVISEEIGKVPKDLAAFIADHRITIWYSTPSILALLSEFGNLAAHDHRALRYVLFAGEVFPVKHLRELTQRWPWAAYYNLYGPTETNVCTFAKIPVPVPVDRTVPYPIGWPCRHCETTVLEAEGGGEVPAGGEGLLYVAGPSVFHGYWNRPDQNGRVFLERNGRRWYNTGDVVRLTESDGYIYIGRRDRMVKRRGYRIELGEIERALYQHGSILEAAAVGVADSAGMKIVAFVSVRKPGRPSIVELKSFCAQSLPAYMSPDVFRFVDALPRTSTDKIDYQDLTRLVETAALTSSA